MHRRVTTSPWPPPKGLKCSHGNYKDGKPDGLWIYYNEYGPEDYRFNFKEGERLIGDASNLLKTRKPKSWASLLIIP